MQVNARKSATWAAIAVGIVAGFEGLRTTAYLDPVGIPTLCFGSTKGVKLGDKKTPEECRQLLAEELEIYAAGVDRCIKTPLSDKTKAAIVSFTYNVGIGAMCKSTLAKKFNAGDQAGGCRELTKWNKAGGVVWPGLTRRRNEEMALCLSGV